MLILAALLQALIRWVYWQKNIKSSDSLLLSPLQIPKAVLFFKGYEKRAMFFSFRTFQYTV
jgi:hypothetical protein